MRDANGGNLRLTDKRETDWERDTMEPEKNACMDKREIGKCEMPTVDD